jgi:LDH2 family malate/lactate/ureidoglycolate dehydrogenase
MAVTAGVPLPDLVLVDAKRLADAVARIFAALGISRADADTVANDLVLADLEGVGSHGVMLVPM